jgi:hypothetical protein
LLHGPSRRKAYSNLLENDITFLFRFEKKEVPKSSNVMKEMTWKMADRFGLIERRKQVTEIFMKIYLFPFLAAMNQQ